MVRPRLSFVWSKSVSAHYPPMLLYHPHDGDHPCFYLSGIAAILEQASSTEQFCSAIRLCNQIWRGLLIGGPVPIDSRLTAFVLSKTALGGTGICDADVEAIITINRAVSALLLADRGCHACP